MTAEARTSDSGTIALEWALAVGCAAVFLASFLFVPETLPSVPLCAFHRVTDLPCPGCGITRAFCCVSHGEFGRAWEYNPFGYALYALGLGLFAWPVWRRRRPALEKRLVASPWFARVPIMLVGSMWMFGLWRIGSILGARL